MNRKWAWVIGSILSFFIVMGQFKPLPDGLSYRSARYPFDDEEVHFLKDITLEKDGKRIIDHEIFDHVCRVISEANDYLILDLFLFINDGTEASGYRALSQDITKALLDKKKHTPDLPVLFITDPINTGYGSFEPKHIQALKAAGVNVVMTDLSKLRDSNLFYSMVWRTFFQWFGQGGKGWIVNPIDPKGPPITVRSLLALLNFKANHRKGVFSEKEGLVLSANPHDLSSFHSNVGVSVSGPILNEMRTSELAVAEFSGADVSPFLDWEDEVEKDTVSDFYIQHVTEKEIKKSFLKMIANLKDGDEVWLAMFYLSDREIIHHLKRAAKKGHKIYIILDPNKDAFGREKNGIPNRQVAYELEGYADHISIRWYETHGEQFHTKLMAVFKHDRAEIMLGSANLTRRNLDDFNLESDVYVSAPLTSIFVKDVRHHLQQLFNNTGGTYTVSFQSYEDTSFMRKHEYRLLESIGLGTF